MSRVVLLLLGLIVKIASHFVCFLTPESSHCRFFPLPCFPDQFCLRFCVILLIVAGQHEQVWHCYCSFLGREKKNLHHLLKQEGVRSLFTQRHCSSLQILPIQTREKDLSRAKQAPSENQLGGEKFKPGLLMLPVKLLPPPSLPPTPSGSAVLSLISSGVKAVGWSVVASEGLSPLS